MRKSFFELDRDCLASIRLLPFDQFQLCGFIPKFPDNQDLTVSASAITSELYEESLLIFISHRWIRPDKSSSGYTDAVGSHPDDSEGRKYHLIRSGVEKILRHMTHNITHCFLWIDYSCVDQDKYAPDEVLSTFEAIIQISDIIFTPLVDPCWPEIAAETWHYEDLPSHNYPSESWNGSMSSYLNRGWCRLEMLSAAFLPTLRQPPQRSKKLIGRLLFHHKADKRPHLLYGSREQSSELSLPHFLPPIPHSSAIQFFNPVDGYVTRRRDKKRIFDFFERLKPFIVERKGGYEGDTSAEGTPHGIGRYIYDQDKTYEGEWKDGMKHGQGKLITFHYSSGFVYEGSFCNGRMEGKGSYLSSAGDVHEGEYHDSLLHGHAIVKYHNGDYYEGSYVHGKKQGEGRFVCRNGDVYEGCFQRNKRQGKGIFTLSQEKERYEGNFHQDSMHGFGSYYYNNGDRYEGEWSKGKMHGQGKYVCANGDVYEGAYEDDMKHGYGVYRYADGKSLYEGEWCLDKKHGKGKMTWGGVEVFEGEWYEDSHTDRGKWTKHWHLLTKSRSKR